MEIVKQRIGLEDIYQAKYRLKDVVYHTPLVLNEYLSEKYECKVYLKREDLQTVRSYKIRGAYNKMITSDSERLENGVVCASAGNHAQGVALACRKLKVEGVIYMPITTPQQKIGKVKRFGQAYVKVILIGDTFDDAYLSALDDANLNNKLFIHPFNDERIIEGQGTVGLEILEDLDVKPDWMFLAVGGGGLASGVGACFHQLSPETQIIGIEPLGAPAMKTSFDNGQVTGLGKIDPFVDGAAVRKVGDITFEYCQTFLSGMHLVPEGRVCTTILELYNEEAIVVEPAGALSVAALDDYREAIKGKTVVCLISGGNNDITRMEEIKERSLIHEGLKHYFVVTFPQRAGALKEFVNEILGPNDDITYFQYTKKNSRSNGPALVGVEVQCQEDYQGIITRMKDRNIHFSARTDHPDLFDFIV